MLCPVLNSASGMVVMYKCEKLGVVVGITLQIIVDLHGPPLSQRCIMIIITPISTVSSIITTITISTLSIITTIRIRIIRVISIIRVTSSLLATLSILFHGVLLRLLYLNGLLKHGPLFCFFIHGIFFHHVL